MVKFTITIRSLAFLVGMAIASTAHAESDWILLTQSYGGIVSLNKHLTRAQCESLRRKVMRVDDLALVEKEYERLIAWEWDRYYAAIAWRDAHPQCKNIFWTWSEDTVAPGDEPVSVDKDGFCDMTGKTFNAMTATSDESKWRPDTNELIRKYDREKALAKFGFPIPGQDGRPGDIKTAECIK